MSKGVIYILTNHPLIIPIPLIAKQNGIIA